MLLAAGKNLLYVMVNSNAMNGKIIGYQTASWVYVMYAIDAALVLALAVWGILAYVKSKRKRSEPVIIVKSDD